MYPTRTFYDSSADKNTKNNVVPFVQLVPWPVPEGVLTPESTILYVQEIINYNESATLRMWRIETNKYVYRWRAVDSYNFCYLFCCVFLRVR